MTWDEALHITRWIDSDPALARLLVKLAELHGPAYFSDVVHFLWQALHPPEEKIPSPFWEEWFTVAGFRADGAPAVPLQVTLYRGARTSKLRGMSWSNSLVRATMYGTLRSNPEEGASVVSAHFQPKDLLASMREIARISKRHTLTEFVVSPAAAATADLTLEKELRSSRAGSVVPHGDRPG